MTAVCCAPNPLYTLTVDEAGAIRDRHFVGGAFATRDPDGWRERINAALASYPFPLHFHKLGHRPDGRYRATKTVIELLRSRPDWYGHYLHIDRLLVDRGYFGNQDHIQFNYWMGTLIKRRTSRAGRCYRVIVATRPRNRGDRYMPELLQQQLDNRSHFDDGPHVELDIRPADDDRLVQVADLIASATRQIHEPSGNPIKEEIAREVASLVRPRGGLIVPSQRIYGWDWRPSAGRETA